MEISSVIPNTMTIFLNSVQILKNVIIPGRERYRIGTLSDSFLSDASCTGLF